MKIKHLALLAAAAMFAACGGRNHTAHDHHDHSHAEHACEAHDHAHEEHNHDAHDHAEHEHEGHAHEAHEHEGHAHEGHAHELNAEHAHEDAHAEHAHADGEIHFSAEQAAAAGVATEVLHASPFAEVIATSGMVESAQGSRTTIVAPASGVVSFKGVYPGSRISGGKAIATLSGRNIAEGDPAEQVRIDYELALKEWQRAGRLVEQKIISEQEYDRLHSAYEVALRRYEALATDAESGIAIKAPADGYVVSVDVANGEYVATGAPLFTVVTGGRMTLVADLPVSKYDRLGDITSANFRMSYGDKVYSTAELGGRIEAVGRCAEGAAYLPVTFVLNAPSEVLSGSFAEVWLCGESREGVISVPRSALTEEQGLYFVYVKTGAECYRKQEVVLGASDGNRVEIKGDHMEGVEVVTSGVYQVKLAAVASIIPEGHSHNH